LYKKNLAVRYLKGYRYISSNFEAVDWLFCKKCITQMGLSLPVPVSSPWTIQDHSFLLIGAAEPIRYRVRIRHWCSRASQIQGLVSSSCNIEDLPFIWLVQPNQSDTGWKDSGAMSSFPWVQTNQSDTGWVIVKVQANQSDTGWEIVIGAAEPSYSRFSLFFFKYPRPFLSSDWCSRTNQIQVKKILI